MGAGKYYIKHNPPGGFENERDIHRRPFRLSRPDRGDDSRTVGRLVATHLRGGALLAPQAVILVAVLAAAAVLLECASYVA